MPRMFVLYKNFKYMLLYKKKYKAYIYLIMHESKLLHFPSQFPIENYHS